MDGDDGDVVLGGPGQERTQDGVGDVGNLLCAVARLLDGGLLGNLLSNLLGAVTDLLNSLLDV